MKNLNDLKSLIDTEEETIDFLVNNKDNWEVENDQIAFYSDELINQYNDLISKLN